MKTSEWWTTLAIRGAEFEGTDVAVGGDSGGYYEALIEIRTVGGDGERFRQLDDEIGLAERPIGGELRDWRCVFRIAFRLRRPRPSAAGVDFARGVRRRSFWKCPPTGFQGGM